MNIESAGPSIFLKEKDRYARKLEMSQGIALYVGSREGMRAFVHGGSWWKRLPWKVHPGTEQVADTRHLVLAPPLSRPDRAWTRVLLSAFPGLISLVLPYELVDCLEGVDLPRGLSILQLRYRHDVAEGTHASWPSISLPQVAWLEIDGSDSARSRWANLCIGSENFPSLRTIVAPLDGKPANAAAVGQFRTLYSAELTQVGNLDVVGLVPPTCEFLRVNGTGRSFALAALDRLARLRGLDLLNIKSEIDCEEFRRATRLEEIEIVSARRLRRLESLLAVPALRSLRFVDCKRPFSPALRRRFEAHGFERLDIEYA